LSLIKAIQVTSSIFLHHHQYIFYKFSHLLVVIASCHLYNHLYHFKDLLFTKMKKETLTYPKSNIFLSSIITSTLYKLIFIKQYDQLTQTPRKDLLAKSRPLIDSKISQTLNWKNSSSYTSPTHSFDIVTSITLILEHSPFFILAS
jgi:hypothetical protein